MPNAQGELTDEEVFGQRLPDAADVFTPQDTGALIGSSAPLPPAGELTDEQVFGPQSGTANPVDNRPSLMDRLSANARDSFVHGTLTGAGTNLAGQKITDAMDPALGEQLHNVRAGRDQAYQQMPPWSGIGEGMAALGGQVMGALPSPENAIALPMKAVAAIPKIGAFAAREGVMPTIVRRGIEGATANVATDPAVQGANIAAGDQAGYDPVRTLLAAPLGFLVGGGTGAAMEWQNIGRGFRDFVTKRRGPDAAGGEFDPSTTTPQDIADFEASPDLRAALTANGIKDVNDPRLAQLEARLLERRKAEAAKTLPAENISVKQNAAEVGRLRAEQEGVATGALDPAAVSTAGAPNPRRAIDLPETPGGPTRITIPGSEAAAAPEIPARPIAVTPEGQAVVSTEPNFPVNERMDQASVKQDAARADVAETFRQADVIKRKGPEYAAQNAEKEKQFNADEHYKSLTERIGEDPAALAERQMAIPKEQFMALPPDAKERVVQSAQRQTVAEQPAAPLRTADAALGEGARPYTPATEPTARVNEVPGESVKKPQPTANELDAGGKPYARSATGTSDRPFPAEDKNLSPDQAKQFEDTARATAEAERQATVDELERKWQERAQAKEGAGPRYKEAEQKWQGKAARDNFTNTPDKQDAEGRYPVDESGFVASNKGGPIKFADQKMAARWIVSQGHKKSPDQIFEIENHPSGKGFTVRERGRTEPPKREEQPATGTKTLAAPDGAGSQPGPAGGPQTAQGGPASRPAAETAKSNAASPDPAPKTEQPKTEKTNEPSTKSDQPAAARTSDNEASTGSNEARTGDSHATTKGDHGPEAKTTDESPDPTKPEGTRETVPPEETGLKEELDHGTSLGTTFYSNPFDPELAKKLLGGPVLRAFKKEKDAMLREARSLKRSMGRVSGANKKGVGQSIADAGRTLINSNRAQMSVIAARYPEIKEIRQMSDMLASQPGEGDRAIKETFNEVVDRRPVQRFQQVLTILHGHEQDDAFLGRVSDILAGRSQPRTDTERSVSARLRKLLDEEHDYAAKGGLEMGYVKGDYFPRVVDRWAVLSDPKAFQEAAAKVYQKMGLAAKDATAAAEEYYHRILGVGQSPYAISDSPASKFTKGRTLPKEADTLLKEFYVTDPIENLASYFRQTTRRVEFAKRFGATGDKADAMFDAMIRQGMKPGDVGMMRLAFDSTTGNISAGKVLDALSGPVSWIQTIGTTALLPRAVIYSMAEAINAGVRTGKALDSLDGFFNGWRAAFSSKNMADRRAAAEALGIIGQAHQHMILSERFGGGMDSRLQGRIVHGLFSRTGLVALTEGQRIATTGIGQEFVRRMLTDVTTGHRVESARQLLNELGIGQEDIPGLMKWMGDKPSVAKMLEDTPEAELYRGAIGRFVDETIQNPKPVDRPALANHPVGRMMYSIMSFQYAFMRNVLMRTGKQVGKAIDPTNNLTMGDRARFMGALLPFTMLMGAQMGVSRMREKIYNAEGDKERTELQKRVLDISRSGITGTLDPLINALASVKYDKDLSNIPIGANLSFFLQGLQKVAGLIPSEYGGKNNPHTNNAEWAATRAAYQMIVAPLANVALSLAPLGPIGKVLAGALIAGPSPIGISTPQRSRSAADAVVGPRTVSAVGQKKEGGRETGRDSGRDSGRKSGR